MGLAILASVQASAHRRDEYLQAARIGIDADRIELELDLTAGIAVAPGVVSDIDRNGNGLFEPEETQVYAERVRRELRFEIDGRPLSLALTEHRFPPPAALFTGDGTIQLEFTAMAPGLTARSHRVFYRNDHRPDIGVYLANALMPGTELLTVAAQQHAVDQRDLTIDYERRGAIRGPLYWWLGAVVMVGLAMVLVRFNDVRA